MACYLVICENITLENVKEAFGTRFLNSLRPYRDAGIGPDNFPLTVIDCVEGVKRASELGWYNFETFDEWQFKNMLENGDLSWIVPGQIIAFSSPTDGHSRTHPAVRP